MQKTTKEKQLKTEIWKRKAKNNKRKTIKDRKEQGEQKL